VNIEESSMSEQPPRASSQVPLPGEPASHRLESDPEAPRTAAGDGAQGRVRERAGEGLDRAADAARRLGHGARERGGLAAHAEPLAYRVGDSLQSAAAYVREHDLDDMRDDVEVGVRRSPLKALALAALGGFLLGRMIR
jgi:hypothetical protein